MSRYLMARTAGVGARLGRRFQSESDKYLFILYRKGGHTKKHKTLG